MALPQLADALSRWEPRLLANGIDPNDLRAVRAEATDWPGWFAAMVRTGLDYEALAREALAGGARLTAGELFVRAALLHHFAQFALFDYPDLMREGHRRKVEAFAQAAPLLAPPVERLTVLYGDCALPVHLRRPATGAPHPWVLLVPGLDSTKEEFHTFEALFLARGLAVATFDGPGQGEVAAAGRPWRPGDELAVVTVVEALRQQPGLDPDRGALAGVSFGGYLAPAAASLAGGRIRACAGIGGCFSLAGSDFDRLPPLIQEDFRHFTGARTMAEARRAGSDVSLLERLRDVQAPILIVHGSQDSIFPPDHARRSAGAGGSKAQLVLLEGGNHVCNNMPLRYRPLVADWIAASVSG
jgi:2,6-dihydroxypseudooxynicotine hydrolase